MSGDSFGCEGAGLGDTSKHPIIHRTDLPQQGIIWSQMSVVLRLRTTALENESLGKTY